MLAVANFVAVEETKESSAWVKHTHEVISEARLLIKTIVDMETGQRGYVITRKEDFLEPFYTGKVTWDKSIESAKIRVSDNPPQIQKLIKIDETIKKWHELAATPEINAARAGNFDLAKNLIEAKTGKSIIDDVRIQINEFIEIEQNLLVVRSKKEERFNFIVLVLNLEEHSLQLFLVLLQSCF